MPLQAFIDEPLRFVQARGGYDAFFQTFNATMAAAATSP